MAETEKPSGGSTRIPPPAWLDRVRELPVQSYLDKWRERFQTNPVTGLPLEPLRRHLEDLDEDLSIETLAFRTGAGLRGALKVFAPICLAMFAGSFFLAPGVLQSVLRSCSIAGLIGFGTNWVAIKMLFRPRESRPIFGQGLIPSQRDELIQKVADEVIEKLINERIIRQELEDSRLIGRLTDETVLELRRVMRDPEFVGDTKQLILTYAARLAKSESFREEVTQTVEERVEEMAGRSFALALVGKMRGVWREPVVRMVNRELDELPETLDHMVGELDTALDHVPRYLESHSERIEKLLTRVVMSLIKEMDVRHVISKQLSAVTSAELEKGFREFSDDKLSYITLLGGILGLVGGFVIIWPLWSVAVLAGLFVLLGILDIAIFSILKAVRGRRAARQGPAER